MYKRPVIRKGDEDRLPENPIKASIVIAVLNSHEIVRRQILHFEKMNLPESVEIVLVDDGSKPEINIKTSLDKFKLCRTYNFSEWTQPLARNFGVNTACGEFVICTDIDHILPKESIEFVINSDYDYIRFKRYVGILDENGEFKDDYEVLKEWGYRRKRKKIGAHGNSYAIRRGLFIGLGGSRQKENYPNRDEIPLKRKVQKLVKQGKITFCPDEERPFIYLIPNCRHAGSKNANPFGLFHNLKR